MKSRYTLFLLFVTLLVLFVTLVLSLLASLLFSRLARSESSPQGACSSSAYALLGWKVTGTYEWWYNPSGEPLNGLATVKAAVTSAFSGKNGCSLQGVAVHQVYKGLTSSRPGVPSSSTCGSSDKKNVIGWGPLTGTTLARTCSWASGTKLKEADVLLNTSKSWFVGPLPTGCSSRFDLAGVLNHETGHVLGLGHSTDATQTMSSKTPPCTVNKRVFWSGDVAGLHALYGN